jgi:uncharacterized membrane protein YgdD (TMEM256/DUF423 family)
VFGAAGVGLGAFGAHALTGILSERGAEVWDTAVQYHLIHALALCVIGLVSRSGRVVSKRIAGWGFGLGMVLFSGSLYLLALDGPSFLGPVTPLGGVCFIVGWIALAVNALSRQSP